jgi:hypothetical protein
MKKKVIFKVLFSFFVFGLFFSNQNIIFAGGPDVIVAGDPKATTQLEQEKKSDNPMENSYVPLAPLPGFTKIDSSFTLSSYIRTLVRVAIGIIGILAVIMIVISGVQYMGSDMFTEKESAKSRLQGAVLGLILAVSSVLILRTINPGLTNIDLEKNIGEVGITASGIEVPKILVNQVIEAKTNDNINNSDDAVDVSKGKSVTSNCPSGVISIPKSLTVKSSSVKIICKDLADKLIELQQILAKKKIVFIITSTVDGTHKSLCHKPKNSKTGNCADIALRETNGNTIAHTDQRWGELCSATISISGLNFLNEATNKGSCARIRPFKTYANTTAPHLHIMYTE